MDIRLAKAEDVFAISEVYSDSVRELCKGDYPDKVITTWQNSTPAESRLPAIEQKTLWVAEIDNCIAGYMMAVPGEIIALFIHSKFAKRGVGFTLGKLGVELAQKGHNGPVTLESTLTAKPFYEKLGFIETGRGFFTHGNDDLKIEVINMQLA